jgi:DNA-binding NtrC family response regulator
MHRLLVIDDDEIGRKLVAAVFSDEGFEVLSAESGEIGLRRAESDAPDVVLLDLTLPGMSGFEVLERLRARAPDLPVVVLSAHTELKMAVRAMQLGAFDYQSKPFDHDEVLIIVRRALEARALRREVQDLRRRIGAGSLQAQMGPSQQVQTIADQVALVASSTLTVLVLGETGTGKEIVAREVHRASDRHDGPFVALDCGAIPDNLFESELFGHEKGAFTGAERRREGRFQLAHGGTLFLDEVGNLPLPQQAKLLRVLESHEVQAVGASRATAADVRVVAATNHDLQEHVAGGEFRGDLYFRLAQYRIALPALRERPADIPYLAQRFLEAAAVELRRPVQKILPDALEILQRHRWSGNVRELKNLIRQAVLETQDLVLRKDIVDRLVGRPGVTRSNDGLGPAQSLREVAERAAREAERGAITEALRTTSGNKTHAAKLLQTDFKTLHVKMRQLGIETDSTR